MDGDLASVSLLMRSINGQCLTMVCTARMSVPATETKHMVWVPERASKDTVYLSHTMLVGTKGACMPQANIKICMNVDFSSVTLSWCHAKVTTPEWWCGPVH